MSLLALGAAEAGSLQRRHDLAGAVEDARAAADLERRLGQAAHHGVIRLAPAATAVKGLQGLGCSAGESEREQEGLHG